MSDDQQIDPKPPFRIVLGRADFAALVNGRIAEWRTSTGQTVLVILSDIGFAAMAAEVSMAELNG